jgi:hypothetical protein
MNVTPTTLRDRRAPRLAVLAIAALAAIAVLLAVVAVLVAVEDRDDAAGTTVVGSGVTATEERALAPFSAIDLSGESALTVRVGGPQSVVVSADDNLVERVTTTVEGGTLVVDTEGSFRTTSPMSITVVVPSLEELGLSGSGAVDAEGVRGEQLVVLLSGDGLVHAAGRVGTLDVTLSGTGDADLAGLVAADVRAELGGTGRIEVHASRTLDASITGTGTITYRGTPQEVTQRVTGTGVVVRG